MKDELQSLVVRSSDPLESANNQSLFVGSALVFFNLLLMFCLGFYWINPSVHQFISGRPL
ncbi:hypothetical protein EV05_1403 [Prochlorococcus sp. MIT 0601]|nr:hypothetical protein EV05_1403 [Prochlorococcus sp. MIT 0601]